MSSNECYILERILENMCSRRMIQKYSYYKVSDLKYQILIFSRFTISDKFIVDLDLHDPDKYHHNNSTADYIMKEFAKGLINGKLY